MASRNPNVVAEAAAVYVFARLALTGLVDDDRDAVRAAAEEAGLVTYTRDGGLTLTTLGRRVANSDIGLRSTYTTNKGEQE